MTASRLLFPMTTHPFSPVALHSPLPYSQLYVSSWFPLLSSFPSISSLVISSHFISFPSLSCPFIAFLFPSVVLLPYRDIFNQLNWPCRRTRSDSDHKSQHPTGIEVISAPIEMQITLCSPAAKQTLLPMHLLQTLMSPITLLLWVMFGITRLLHRLVRRLDPLSAFKICAICLVIDSWLVCDGTEQSYLLL